MLDQVLSTAKDFVVLDKIEKKVVVAFPFQGNIAKHYFDQTISNAEESKVEGFNGHWEFNDKTGLIEGSSTLLTLRLDEATRKTLAVNKIIITTKKNFIIILLPCLNIFLNTIAKLNPCQRA